MGALRDWGKWSPQNNLHPFCEQFKFAESHCLKVLLLLSFKFADKILSESVLLLLLLICDAGFDSSRAIFNSLLLVIQRKLFIQFGQSIHIAYLSVTRMITLLLVIYLEINELSVIDWTMSYLWDNLSTQWRQRANKRYSNSHFLPGVTLDNNYIQEYKLKWKFSLLTKKAILTKIALIEEAAALMNRLVNQ